MAADFPTHQFDELLADGRTKSRATEAPRGRVIGLGEAVENLALRFARDAYSCVDDLEPHADHLAYCRHSCESHLDAAAFCELDGITN